MTRRMRPADVEAVVGIHAASWSPRELSVKLGPEFLRSFYQQVLRSEHAFGYVASDGDTVIGYAIGFGHYAAFNKELSRALGLAKWSLVLRGLTRGRIRPPDLLNLLLDRRKFRNARFARYHLGAIALAERFKGTPPGRAAVHDLMHSVEQALL